MLDVYSASEEATLCIESQIAELKYVHRYSLHADTTLFTITSKYICKCSVYNETCYES